MVLTPLRRVVSGIKRRFSEAVSQFDQNFSQRESLQFRNWWTFSVLESKIRVKIHEKSLDFAKIQSKIDRWNMSEGVAKTVETMSTADASSSSAAAAAAAETGSKKAFFKIWCQIHQNRITIMIFLHANQ